MVGWVLTGSTSSVIQQQQLSIVPQQHDDCAPDENDPEKNPIITKITARFLNMFLTINTLLIFVLHYSIYNRQLKK